MVSLGTNRRASIDLGTNTCLLLVIEGDRVLHDESRVVRLGQEVDRTGKLHPDAMKRTLECLIDYARIVRDFEVDPGTVLAVGTASSRDASNSAEFYSQVQQQTGFRFRVLSGDEEAQATFLGAALPGMSPSQMVVMDIGGGSTELVSNQGGESLNIGAVRMTERFLKSNPVTDAEFWAAESAIDQELSRLKSWRRGLGPAEALNFVAVAGTAVTLAMLQEGLTAFDRARLDGLVLTRGDAHRWVEELKWRTVSERESMTGMEKKRADVILAGTLIYWRVMEVLDFPTSTISTRGLRYGVFQLGLKNPKP